ncbi:hypothetical protein [Natrialba sp. PRR66]|nr:hypothetical protein [Natrialba sp. PRR66]
MATTAETEPEAIRAVDLDEFEGADVYQERDKRAEYAVTSR